MTPSPSVHSRPRLHVVRTQGIPIVEQLAVEEALLRADTRNWFLWNEGSTPAVVLGISGKIQELIDRTNWESSGLPLIRRFSGGGTVVVDEQTLLASWILNKQALPSVSADPNSLLLWVGSHVESAGIAIRTQDFVWGEQKVGGNAQYLCKERWLHHTSFLWDFRPDRMNILRLPEKRPAYRADRDHCSFCRPLAHELPSPDALLKTILTRLDQQFELISMCWEDAKLVVERPHRKTVRQELWPTAVAEKARQG